MDVLSIKFYHLSRLTIKYMFAQIQGKIYIYIYSYSLDTDKTPYGLNENNKSCPLYSAKLDFQMINL